MISYLQRYSILPALGFKRIDIFHTLSKLSLFEAWQVQTSPCLYQLFRIVRTLSTTYKSREYKVVDSDSVYPSVLLPGCNTNPFLYHVNVGIGLLTPLLQVRVRSLLVLPDPAESLIIKDGVTEIRILVKIT